MPENVLGFLPFELPDCHGFHLPFSRFFFPAIIFLLSLLIVSCFLAILGGDVFIIVFYRNCPI